MTEGDDRMRRSMFWTWVFQSCPGGIAHSADSALLPTRPSAMDSPPACQICQICQVLWSWSRQMPPAGRCQRCPSPQRRARNTWNFHSVCVFSIDSIDFCKFKLCLQLQVGWQHAPKAPVGHYLLPIVHCSQRLFTEKSSWSNKRSCCANKFFCRSWHPRVWCDSCGKWMLLELASWRNCRNNME